MTASGDRPSGALVEVQGFGMGKTDTDPAVLRKAFLGNAHKRRVNLQCM